MYRLSSWLLTLVMVFGAATPVAAGDTRPAQAQKPAPKEAVKTSAKKFVTRAVTIEGTLIEVVSGTNGTVLKVKVTAAWPKQAKKWAAVYPIKDKVVSVKVSDKTRLMRRHGHKSSVVEFSVGDTLRVVGKLQQDGSVTAINVRDRSIFVAERTGVVEGLDATLSSFLLKSPEVTWTVKTSSVTAFTVTGIDTASFADVKVGDTAAVRGLVNTTSKTITATGVKVTARAPIVETTPTTPAPTTP